MATDADIPTIRELQLENEGLRERLQVAEDTLLAIRSGNVDSLIARTPEGYRVFSLEDAHTSYRLFVEEMQQGAAMVDPRGTILFSNHSLAAILRMPRERIIGASWPDLVAEEDRPKLAELVSNSAAGRAQAELSLRAADGTIVPVSVTANPLSSEGIDAVCLVVTDLTERREAEKERIRLARLIDLARDAIFIRDEEGTISYWNEGAERLYGWSRAEALGRRAHELLKADFPRPLHKLAADVKKLGAWEGELTHTGRDGRRIIVASRWLLDRVPEFGPDAFRILEIDTDVTARRVAEDEFMELHAQLEERVHDRTRQLEESNKELEAFCYAVSHDLRAPLRGIDGFTQALVEDYAPHLDDKARHWCERIRAASQKMDQLIEDLLRLSRTTRGELSVGVVDLSAIARQIADDLRMADPTRQVDFIIAPELLFNGDARLLLIVLENLLGNAWKFTGKHERARIAFGADWSHGWATYFVRDDGAGFDMSAANRLFTPFQRLHSTAEFPGNGIGLATVKRVIQRHGGQIWAESAVERGATFFFTLGSPAQYLASEYRACRDRSTPAGQ